MSERPRDSQRHKVWMAWFEFARSNHATPLTPPLTWTDDQAVRRLKRAIKTEWWNKVDVTTRINPFTNGQHFYPGTVGTLHRTRVDITSSAVYLRSPLQVKYRHLSSSVARPVVLSDRMPWADPDFYWPNGMIDVEDLCFALAEALQPADEAWHAPRFCANLLVLIRKFVGEEAAKQLKACFRKHAVRSMVITPELRAKRREIWMARQAAKLPERINAIYDALMEAP